ncbi:MAG: hypothetical protein LiPW39_300 [Parcubacteria group bacterium LiPW_39]|nr:MAG: hypothetical protein LiPW39_300 [Parcubacteria group bacterium LiPW_39]
MLDIAIQIVNYNTKKYLIDCVNDVINDLKNCGISYRILVLDNDSQDDLSDLREKYKETVNFYKSEKNLGFGAGHNFLARKLDTDFLLILNPDLKFVGKDTVARMLDFFQKNEDKKIAVAGPLLFNDEGNQRWDHGDFKGLIPGFFTRLGLNYWRNTDKITEVAWVSGAFFLVRRNAFVAVEGFDENFFLYGEEVDFCLRLRKLGYKTIYNPNIKVFHYVSVVASKNKYLDDSDLYFLEKHLKKEFPTVYLFVSSLIKIRKKLGFNIFYK